MELRDIKSSQQEIDFEVAQVNTGGRITMPASFDSMRELLTTLDDALPCNPFLRKWLKSRVGKEETHAVKGRGRFKGRGGRVGSRGNFGGLASRFLRNKEVEVEYMSLDDLEEIKVTSKTSEELVPVNYVVKVARVEEVCDEPQN